MVVVVVGWGSEFSDSWGKRGEGGQGREGVQLPDSLVDEAVFQSVCPGLETPQFNSKNVVLPTSSRNSRLYARLKTGRRYEYVQKHCDLQDKKHENTVLSGEREAAASVVRAAIFAVKFTETETAESVSCLISLFYKITMFCCLLHLCVCLVPFCPYLVFPVLVSRY